MLSAWRLGANMIESTNSLWRWQVLTVSMLVLGYAGYYLCRSDYSVALPLIMAELAARGIPVSVATIQMGSIASLGVLALSLIHI